MNIDYYPDQDVVVIAGMRYSGEMFRQLSLASPGTWLRISERRDQVLVFNTVPEETERVFDQLAGIVTPTKG